MFWKQILCAFLNQDTRLEYCGAVIANVWSLKFEAAKAAELLKKDDPPIAFVIFDCTEGEKDTCSKYGVSGYPTFKIFKPGEVSQDYTVHKNPKVSSNTWESRKSKLLKTSRNCRCQRNHNLWILRKELEFVKDLQDKNREKFHFRSVEGTRRNWCCWNLVKENFNGFAGVTTRDSERLC